MEKIEVLRSFIPYDENHHYPMENLPLGVYSTIENPKQKHCCTRIGDFIIDLAKIEELGLLKGSKFDDAQDSNIFNQQYINKFMELGHQYWHELRVVLQRMFSEETSLTEEQKQQIMTPYNERVKQHIPVFIRDFSDFNSSKHHAFNVGVLFRGVANALYPNWLHIPVAYHSRASTVVVSGTEIRRPKGQISFDKKTPVWHVSKSLDFELEMGAYIGVENEMGRPIKMKDADKHIFGFAIMNDWSERDQLAWEFSPLGPFNSKNFATSISPWVVTAEALQPFRTPLPPQDPEPLPYLKDDNNYSYDVNLDVFLQTEKQQKPQQITHTNFKYMYWSTNQQLTHHTVTGCKMAVGDLIGSGSISGTDKDSNGSFIGRTERVVLESGEEREYLEDGDILTIKGYCKGNGYTIGFGECQGRILPALDDSEYF